MGFGAIRVGEPVAELTALLGARWIDPPALPQHRSRTATVQRAGRPIATAEIDVGRDTVFEIAISDPDATTRAGIRIGATEAELAQAYGAPARTYQRDDDDGLCRQYTTAPGIDFCGAQTLERFRIPARFAPPLALGEDLAALTTQLDGHVLRGIPLLAGHLGPRAAALVAPCLLAVSDGDHPSHTLADAVISHAGAVYDSAGGWRRADGSIVICTSSTAAFPASVFEIDPTGRGTRWVFEYASYFRPEPAECAVVPPSGEGEFSLPRITCRGATEHARGFTGDFVDALAGAFVVPTTLPDDGSSVAYVTGRTRALAMTRAVRSDGAPSDTCDRRLVQAWTTSVPARDALGLPTDDAARLAYLGGGLAPHFRAWCLAPGGLAASPPTIDYRPDRTHAPYTATERHARERELVGAWHRDRRYYTDDWTFTAAGLQIDRGDRHAYSLPGPGELVIGPGDPPRTYQFARAGKDRIFVADRGISCPREPTHAELDLPAGWLLIRGGTCSLISKHDRLAPATCTQVTDHTLAVRYVDDDGHDQHFALEEADGCYVEDTVAPFVRRAP